MVDFGQHDDLRAALSHTLGMIRSTPSSEGGLSIVELPSDREILDEVRRLKTSDTAEQKGMLGALGALDLLLAAERYEDET